LTSYLGNGFGVEPRLIHSAFFRPHNRSEDIKNLYLVGQGTQPGGGTPSVMMSAKMTARVIAKDFEIRDSSLNQPSSTRVTEQREEKETVNVGD
jgi:phytoene desaturase